MMVMMIRTLNWWWYVNDDDIEYASQCTVPMYHQLFCVCGFIFMNFCILLCQCLCLCIFLSLNCLCHCQTQCQYHQLFCVCGLMFCSICVSKEHLCKQCGTKTVSTFQKHRFLKTAKQLWTACIENIFSWVDYEYISEIFPYQDCFCSIYNWIVFHPLNYGLMCSDATAGQELIFKIKPLLRNEDGHLEMHTRSVVRSNFPYKIFICKRVDKAFKNGRLKMHT